MVLKGQIIFNKTKESSYDELARRIRRTSEEDLHSNKEYTTSLPLKTVIFPSKKEYYME